MSQVDRVLMLGREVAVLLSTGDFLGGKVPPHVTKKIVDIYEEATLKEKDDNESGRAHLRKKLAREMNDSPDLELVIEAAIVQSWRISQKLREVVLGRIQELSILGRNRERLNRMARSVFLDRHGNPRWLCEQILHSVPVDQKDLDYLLGDKPEVDTVIPIVERLFNHFGKAKAAGVDFSPFCYAIPVIAEGDQKSKDRMLKRLRDTHLLGQEILDDLIRIFLTKDLFAELRGLTLMAMKSYRTRFTQSVIGIPPNSENRNRWLDLFLETPWTDDENGKNMFRRLLLSADWLDMRRRLLRALEGMQTTYWFWEKVAPLVEELQVAMRNSGDETTANQLASMRFIEMGFDDCVLSALMGKHESKKLLRQFLKNESKLDRLFEMFDGESRETRAKILELLRRSGKASEQVAKKLEERLFTMGNRDSDAEELIRMIEAIKQPYNNDRLRRLLTSWILNEQDSQTKRRLQESFDRLFPVAAPQDGS